MSYRCVLFGEWCALWNVACAVHRVHAQHIYVTAFDERVVQVRNARTLRACDTRTSCENAILARLL